MCSPARCRNCSKTTWSGCGSHVDQVMRRVPQDDRCRCEGSDRKPAGLMARILGR
jgi:hypothetical protein